MNDSKSLDLLVLLWYNICATQNRINYGLMVFSFAEGMLYPFLRILSITVEFDKNANSNR